MTWVCTYKNILSSENARRDLRLHAEGGKKNRKGGKSETGKNRATGREGEREGAKAPSPLCASTPPPPPPPISGVRSRVRSGVRFWLVCKTSVNHPRFGRLCEKAGMSTRNVMLAKKEKLEQDLKALEKNVRSR